MGEAHVFQGVEGGFVDVVESAAAIFCLAAVEVKVGLLVAEQSGKKLVNIHIAKVKNIIKSQSDNENLFIFAA